MANSELSGWLGNHSALQCSSSFVCRVSDLLSKADSSHRGDETCGHVTQGCSEGPDQARRCSDGNRENRSPGFTPEDFTFSTTRRRRLSPFRRSTESLSGLEPPVEVILVIDTLNLPASQISLAKSEAERFLRENHGHLAQPVSLYILSSPLSSSVPRLSSMPAPSTDGNALADAIARGGELPVMRQIPAFHVGPVLWDQGVGNRTPSAEPLTKLSWFHCAGGAAEARQKAAVLAEPGLAGLGQTPSTRSQNSQPGCARRGSASGAGRTRIAIMPTNVFLLP